MVSVILDNLAARVSEAEILQSYPTLTSADINAGGYSTLTHGGLSVLEVASPFIEISKMEEQ